LRQTVAREADGKVTEVEEGWGGEIDREEVQETCKKEDSKHIGARADTGNRGGKKLKSTANWLPIGFAWISPIAFVQQ
jgi:hypothetical protein